MNITGGSVTAGIINQSGGSASFAASTTAALSQARYRLAATTAGSKAVFAGGYANSGDSSVVDIYDATTNAWSTAALSQARYAWPPLPRAARPSSLEGAAAAAIAQCRGHLRQHEQQLVHRRPLPGPLTSSPRPPPAARPSSPAGTASSGYSSVVDIYDSTNNNWTTAALSQAPLLSSPRPPPATRPSSLEG